MKHDRLFTWIEASITGFFLSFTAMACLTTAFSMEPVSLWLLALFCAGTATLCGFLCSRRLGLVMLGLVALGLGFLWQNGILLESLESLLNKISRVYHDAYNWQIIRWSWRDVLTLEKTLAPIIYLLGALIAALTAWTIAKGQSSIVACLPAALPVAACFVVTDSLPDTLWLVFFLTTMGVLMLCSHTRQSDRHQGRRLAAMTAIPVFFAVSLLFLAVPKQTYYHQQKAQAVEDFFLGKYSLEQMMERLAGNAVQMAEKRVDLAALGAREDNKTPVMEVTTRHNGGTLYLRSSALDRYTGKQWIESQANLSELYWPAPADGEAYRTDEVVIKTQFAHEMLYLPYYPSSMDISTMTRGMQNTNKLNEYSVTRVYLDHWSVQFEADRTVTEAQQQQIVAATRLPENTRQWATPLAQSIVGDQKDPYYQALYIAEYVKSSARYDKNTGPMPGQYADFVQWFIEKSDTGYCVHYASAGAVLLKALGIPARYVSGYMVNTRVGTPKEVTVSDAHAWVEYWLPGFGWTVLECTPESSSPEILPNPTQSATAPTAPDIITPDTPVLPDSDRTDLGRVQWEKALYLLLIPVMLGIIWLQRTLRLLYRRKGMEKCNANARGLMLWVQAEKLSRYLKTQPPEPLRCLAEKAKFSPYTLTDAELAEFDTYLEKAKNRLQKKNFLCRLWYKWVLVLY